MLYKENWEQTQKRYEAYWARENHDSPIISVCAPRNRQAPAIPSHHATLQDRWFDTEYQLQQVNRSFQNTYFGGDAIPHWFPNLGPDLFAACYGVPLTFGEDTSWAKHNMQEWDEYHEFVLDKTGFYYQKLMDMTAEAIKDGKDKYFVSLTDIHPALDCLVAMRSPEALCMDTIDRPGFIKKAALELFEGFKAMVDDSHDLINRSQTQTGSCNWTGIWHPGKWYVTSCDFICMISPAMFEDLVVEELELELDFLDASIFHLDGPGALKHLDRLLAMERLNGIQWVYGAGQPGAPHWLDILKKIQNADRLIQISIHPDDLDVLLENLKPEGVMYTTWAASEDEANNLIKKASAYTKKLF